MTMRMTDSNPEGKGPHGARRDVGKLSSAPEGPGAQQGGGQAVMARAAAERAEGLRRYRLEVRRESRMVFAAYLQKVAVDLRLPVACDARTVARWEDGDVRWPQEPYRRLLSVATGREPTELGFMPRGGGQLTSGARANEDDRANTVVDPAADWPDVHRRTLLAGAAAGLAALAGSSTTDTWRDDTFDRLRANAHEIDLDTAYDMREIALRYRRSYRSMSPAKLMPHAFNHLQLLVDLRPGQQTAAVRAGLVTALGEMAVLIGTMWSLDRREFATGEQYLVLAARAAQEAFNPDLEAFVLGARAFHEAYSGNLSAGLYCIDNARLVARRGTSGTNRGWLAAVASELHASAGDQRRCQELLEVAADCLSEAEEGPWVGVGAFDSAKLRAYRGGAMRRLGRYGEAVKELTEALDELSPSMLKHRCTALIDLAEAHVLARDADQAAIRALEALTLAQRTGHEASVQRLRSVHRDLQSYAYGVGAVKQLQAAL